jgi:hypothetical protein
MNRIKCFGFIVLLVIGGLIGLPSQPVANHVDLLLRGCPESAPPGDHPPAPSADVLLAALFHVVRHSTGRKILCPQDVLVITITAFASKRRF